MTWEISEFVVVVVVIIIIKQDEPLARNGHSGNLDSMKGAHITTFGKGELTLEDICPEMPVMDS